jgi:DNA-binding transcriptional MerR regulator
MWKAPFVNMQPTLYNVTTTAQIAGVHPQTLRHYEKIGLVVPCRTLGGVRRYTKFDIERLKAIALLTARGINLEGVGVIMQQQEEINILRRQLLIESDDTFFMSGPSGTNIERGNKASIRERIRWFRQFRRQQRNSSLQISRRPLQIEQR